MASRENELPSSTSGHLRAAFSHCDVNRDISVDRHPPNVNRTLSKKWTCKVRIKKVLCHSAGPLLVVVTWEKISHTFLLITYSLLSQHVQCHRYSLSLAVLLEHDWNDKTNLRVPVQSRLAQQEHFNADQEEIVLGHERLPIAVVSGVS